MSVEGFAVGKWAVEQLFRLWQWIRGDRKGKTKKPLRVVFKPRSSWWGWGTRNREPAMQLVARWSISNLWEEPIKVVRAFEKSTATEIHVLTKDVESNYWGSFAVPGQSQTELDLSFFLFPVPRKARDGRDFKCVLVFIDQVGNRYKERVVLKGRPKRNPEEDKPDPGEMVRAIADPIEKRVVSVLKDELTRYRDCGRRVGGLGSVQTTIGDRTVRGVGTDSRTPDVPKNQSILENASPMSVSSDNADGLVRYFEGLDAEEKTRYVAAITSRVFKDTEYSAIGYFGFLVLFRIGELRVALETARDQLQGDNEFGFSDLLMLLSGLLRYEHISFSDDDLDHIEEFVTGIEEYSFRILERVSAVRAFRVRSSA